MSLGPEAAAIVTKVVSPMPTPAMVETGIFAAGESLLNLLPRVQLVRLAEDSL